MAAVNPDAHDYFYKLALEYYVAARASLLCRCSLITGNLIHHTVELLLKGQLSKTIPLEDLKDYKKFGHNLPKLWAPFKAVFPTENLSEFDAMITELEKFEKIRYPDEILARGAQIGLGWGRGKPVTNLTPNRPEPEYQMGMGDVDAFFKRLFPLCRMNPKAYFTFLSPQGRSVLTEANTDANNWVQSRSQ